MTVQKDVTKNIYVGNGSTRTFPFTFECPAEHPEYIKVYLMQDDGTALATSDYQLDMDARQITYPSSGTALPEGKKLVIMRELPLQQMMNLVNNGPYFAEDVETAFDENVMAMQQIAEKLNRSIIMSVDIDGDAFVNEVPFEAGKSFRIADDGKSIVLTEDPAKVLPLAQSKLEAATAQANIAAASAAAAAKSENNAAISASASNNSAQSASTSAASAAENAELTSGYKQEALTAKADATASATNAKASEANAKISENNAEASKEAAQSAATTASNFAAGAQNSAREAKTYRDNAKTYMDNAKNYSENVNVFVPSVSAEGVLSWSNKAGLTNPPSVNIKGKDGADGSITVDTELSSTSTNPVQNKVIYSALEDKMNTKDIISGFALLGGATNIRWREGTQFIGSINAANYSGTARAATHDGAGNIISETYAKKTDISGVTVDSELSDTSLNPVQNKVIKKALDNKLDTTGTALYAKMDSAGYNIATTYVRSVNGVAPDSYGNVAINVSGGGGSSITVDAELSETSINPVQNKVIKGALDDKANLNKNNTFSKDNYFQKGISLIAYRDLDSAIKWYQSTANPPVASIDATNYTGNAASATKATQDSEGNVITETYAKKVDVSGVVKSVNGIKPNTDGNVTINISGGSGVSTSESNTWTAQQNFRDLMLNREKYTTYVVNGTSDTPVTSTMVYAVTGAFTLNLATLAGALKASESSVFTAYFAANADYSLTINNAGKLKYVGSASDVAITSSGLLLNIWMSKDGGGTLTSIVQANKLA